MDAASLHTLAEQVLAAHYHVAGAAVEPRPGYMSDVAWVEAAGQRWVLKVHHRCGTDADRLAETHRFVEFLARHGYPTPAPQPAASGRTLVAAAGRLCALFPFVEGTPFEPGRRDQLLAAGLSLGQLHRLSREFHPQTSQTAHAAVARILSHNRRELERVAGRLAPGLERRLSHCLGSAESLAEPQPGPMIHGDFRGQNVLFSGDRVAGVLDFDNAEPAPRLIDLAYALVFFAAVLASAPMTREELESFLAAYESESPLSEREREGLPAYLRFSWVRGMLLWARIAYLDRASDKAAGWIAAYAGLVERFGPSGG